MSLSQSILRALRTRLWLVPLLVAPLNFHASQSNAETATTDSTAAAAEEAIPSTEDTQIESRELELVSEELETLFIFDGEVKITGTNLIVTCDRLEVRTRKIGEQGNSFGQIGPITQIKAMGNVDIRQAGRTANAEQAELYPEEGRILLTGNPVVRDLQGEVSGKRIILMRNQRRAIVEGGENRARVRLGQLPNLGFQEQEASKESEAPSNQSEQESSSSNK